MAHAGQTVRSKTGEERGVALWPAVTATGQQQQQTATGRRSTQSRGSPPKSSQETRNRVAIFIARDRRTSWTVSSPSCLTFPTSAAEEGEVGKGSRIVHHTIVRTPDSGMPCGHHHGRGATVKQPPSPKQPSGRERSKGKRGGCPVATVSATGRQQP